MLKKCLHELEILYSEASDILKILSLNYSNEITRKLCERFYLLQEYFVMRYEEAKAHAIVVLGNAEAALFLP
jgi:hypothetical protein